MTPVRLSLAMLFLAAASLTQAGEPRTEFTRMVAHWSQYGDEAYLDFIDEAQPEQVQLGFYGGHFWFHTPKDGAGCTEAALLEPIARACAAALDAIENEDGTSIHEEVADGD